MKEIKERTVGITVWLPLSMIQALDTYLPHVSRNKSVRAILENDKILMKKVKELNHE